jgi:hypothetical protein
VKDPRFVALGMQHVRIVIPWDMYDREPLRTYGWLKKLGDAGQEPLVAFEHSAGDNCPGSPCTKPSVADYAAAFKRFHEAFPWVREYTPWNEANHSSQPTADDPARAAAYYDAVNEVCPDCTVTAADVLDDLATMQPWLAGFRAAVHGDPLLWGLHNYGDTNRFRATGTDLMLQLVPGAVWLTETGGIVRFVSNGQPVFEYDEQRAADALDQAFDLATLRAQRIPRMYLYQWKANEGSWTTFDAGLVGYDWSSRPGLAVVQRRLVPGSGGVVDEAGGPTRIAAETQRPFDAGTPAAAVPARDGRAIIGTMRKLVHLRRGHRLPVALLCPGAAGCRGRVTLRAAGRTIVLATSARFALGPGAASVVSLRLSARAVGRMRMLGSRAIPVRLALLGDGAPPVAYGKAFRLAVPRH